MTVEQRQFERLRRRRRLAVLGCAVGVAVLVLALFLAVRLGGTTLESGKGTVAAPSLDGTLAAVPSSTFDRVGIGTATTFPAKVTQPALSSGAKPEIFFVGAEYCPYCAAERWAIAVAMSRFGSFAHLGTTFSSPDDVDPNTPTLTFHGATYTSRYLTFTGKEIYTNKVSNGHYTALDTLTPKQFAVFKKDSGGSFPFLDMNGEFTLNSAQYDGASLAGMTQVQIAKRIADPAAPVSKGVIGSANILTARLCQVTGGKPSSVCTSAGVRDAAHAIAVASHRR